MDNQWFDVFSAITNLTICLVVVLYGVYWIRDVLVHGPNYFVFRTYALWWCSWVVWCIVWALLLWKATLKGVAGKILGVTLSQLQIEMLVLLFDNLNTLFLVLTFSSILRGHEYTLRKARSDFLRMALSLVLAYYAIYLSLGVLAGNILLAHVVHKTWSLCLSVFAPIVIGWAVARRFNTRVVLSVGFVYGVMQPIAYATQLKVDASAEFLASIAQLQPLIAMILAAMKVAWAIVCTKVFSSVGVFPRSLVVQERVTVTWSWKGWRPSIRLHAILLAIVFILLGTFMVVMYLSMPQYSGFLGTIIVGFGFVVTLLGLIQFVGWLWDRFSDD